MHADDPTEATRLFLPAGYVSRPEPVYFLDEDARGRTWQPHVYPLAAAVARRSDARHIVDVGCGRGRKLVELQGAFETIGVDYGPNLAYCREHYANGRWLEADLEGLWPFTLDEPTARTAVVVCSDVIEHLKDPGELLAALSHLGRSAPAVLVSTPERVRTQGPQHMGPPTNPAHVREWSLEELTRLLIHHGLSPAFAGLTVSDDETLSPRTSLVVCVPPSTGDADRRATGEFCRDTLRRLYEKDLEERRQRRAAGDGR